MAHSGLLGVRGLAQAGPRRAAARRRGAGLVPGFEMLEERVVLSTFTVTNTNNDGAGSLRAAIDLANADPAQDTIDFASSVTGTISLRSALPALSTAILLSGPGSSALTVARSSDPSTPEFGIFNVPAKAEVVISGLTISGGRGPASGGAIANSGTLTVTDSTLSGNSSSGAGFSNGGGGIANFGTVTVTNSTISGNSASKGLGGGILNVSGVVTITDSTLSGNSANEGGGGIASFTNGGIVTVINSTLSGNSAGLGGGGGIGSGFGTVTVTSSTISGNSASDGNGGGILSSGALTVTGSTLSGNLSGSSGGGIIFSGTVTITTSLFNNSESGNLTQTASASFVSGGHNLFSDLPGLALNPTDLVNTDPLLGPLADNGGPTQTMALLPGSPAINAGRNMPGVTTDQRGVPHPQGAAPDIGAFEVVTAPFVRLTPDTATRLVGASHSVIATVLDPNVKPLVGVPVTFQVTAGPNAGATGFISPVSSQSDANGQVSFRYADTGGIGTDSIVATAILPGGPSIASLAATVIWTTFTVTNTNDSGVGSLRAALSIADQNPGRDTITFAPGVAGTITLRSALPDLATDIILSGPGASALTVARSSDPLTPEFRIFNVTAGANVEISGLTVSGGRVSFQNGGGIANSGTLTVTDSAFSGNSASFGSGGGIANLGTLTVIHSTLTGNSANDFRGGGIANDNFGTVTVIDSTLTGNSAGFGGGIDNINFGLVTITNSTLESNSASIDGGGISSFYATLRVTGITLSGNSTRGDGGGILILTGTVSVTDSTLHGNSAGFLGNGGGIVNRGGFVTITNSTFSDNAANSGGGVFNDFGTVTVTTSLFANSKGGNLNQGRNAASFVSGGHNLFSDTPALAFDPTDLLNTDPLLGPLADNGGPTQTMALLPGSPAIDAGRTVPGVTADQRGVLRPQGAAPDIGAFESRGFTLVIVSGNNQGTIPGTTFPLPLVVRVASAFGEPVAGGWVRFAAPTAGASANVSSNLVPIDASGQASVFAVANDLVGSYAVTAEVPGGAMNSAFALENRIVPPPVEVPLTVVGVQRYGFHAQPTTLVLRFSAALDPVRAQDLANYQIVTLGGHGRRGARVGQVTRVRAAVYDAATGSVTLHPAQRLDPRNTYRLTVRGTAPGGVASSTGVFLDGVGTGQPGSDFVTTIARGIVVRPSRAFFNQVRYRWASLVGITGR
ncbi:right-handed parallel beta-helix repeat-containing protein [Singulisphaera sp. Ch08]|uniref:Right-handed parallel beta-helix repeat-containing protein n=1 Tax=Singulisphaera sp. Ch08 TaxID=3120278 RepID=A0AAU7CK86_9BACT